MTPDVQLFTFDALGLNFSPRHTYFLRVRLPSEAGKTVTRMYSPIIKPKPLDKEMDILVKFYPGGQMSKQWQLLPIGEPVEMALESEKEHYIKENHDSVVAIAASTGIAPILNIITSIISDPTDKNHITLLFANKTYEDIMLRDELIEMVQKHENLDIIFLIGQVPKDIEPLPRVTYLEGDKISSSVLSHPSVAARITPKTYITVCAAAHVEKTIQTQLFNIYGKAQIEKQIFMHSHRGRIPLPPDGSVPALPQPGDCCGQSCINCVWMQYIQEIHKYFASKGLQDDKDELIRIVEELDVDPSVKAFLRMEVKLMN